MRTLLRDTWDNDLSRQLLAETEGVKATGDTADAANAIAGFVAKRRPQFEGR
jgi:2-(1,2-epoxy-1,2-dihydrophenyl)acetyl-CoA isomerase